MPSIRSTRRIRRTHHHAAPLQLDFLEPRTLLSAVIPNDPKFPAQYNLQKIDAPDAWNITTGGGGSSDVVVAVLDTGIDLSHPDLAANIWTNPNPNANPAYPNAIHGWNFLDNNNDVSDNFLHGTAVAGVIGAVGNNGKGIAGVDWNVKILPLEVGTALGVDDTAVANAINYVTALKKQGVNIVAINASYISFTPPTLSEISAINNAGHAGILYVAAAGNAGLNLDAIYPSSFIPSNLIFVANTNESDGLASDSSYGAHTVAVGAPGTDITTTIPGGGYMSLSGTSFAAPEVTGIAALLKSAYPTATMMQIKSAILKSGDPDPALAGKTITGKRVNALAALEALDQPVKPIGAVETRTATTVTGYAYDANAHDAPIYVAVSVDNHMQPPIAANQSDPAAPYPTHGFSYTLPALPYGRHLVKVFALDNPTNKPILIGKGKVVVNTPPTGAVDQLTATATAITGFAQDPDTPTRPVHLRLFLDGHPWRGLLARLPRPDLAAALGSPNHGFAFPIGKLPAGAHTLTIDAVDTLTHDLVTIGTLTLPLA